MPPHDSPPWMVKVRRTAPPGVGSGMLVTERLVLTCAHVVGPAPATAAAPVLVEFQFLAAHEPIEAVVVPGGWHPGPAGDSMRADVAVLELREAPPAGAVPAPLRPTGDGVAGHAFRAYGYPDGHTAVGVPAEGRVISQAGRERLAVVSQSVLGHAMGPGFSGSPLWDETLGGVIGILAARDKVRRDQPDQRTAYAIPNDVLAGYWPELTRLIAAAGAFGTPRELLEDVLDLPLPPDGLLPRVTDIPMYDIGVSPAKPVSGGDPSSLPYSPRQVDAALSEALGRESFLVLIGDSKAGKSRTMLELLRRERPDARLLVPRAGPPGLAALRRLPFPDGGDPVVIWLDDLDRFLGPHGIDLKVLNDFHERGRDTVVVGTIKAKQYEDLQRTEGEVGRTARLVLGRAHEVWLPRLLTDEERQDARERYPGEDFSERGIGEQLVAAAELERFYRAAQATGALPWAVLRAAVDWRRIGMDRPVPPDVLREMAHQYAPAAGDDFEASLHRVVQPVAGSIALLRRVERHGVDGYEAFDYVVALADGQGGAEGLPIAPVAWDTAARVGAPMELLGVAFALLTRGDLVRAREAADRAHRGATDEMTRIWAAQLLGELTFAAGDAQAARDLFVEVIDGPAPEAVPFARLNLGVVLLTLGEWEEARPILEAVLDTEHPELTALAKAQLGGLILTEQGQEPARSPGQGGDARGISAFGDVLNRERISAASRQLVPLAQINLSNLLMNRGELARAQALLEEAITSHSPEVVPLAQANLGFLLVNMGDEQRGRGLLEEAAASADVNAQLSARTTLGLLLLQSGDTERSAELFAEVVATGVPEHAGRAADLLGDLRAASGDVAGAREAYRRSMATGHWFWAPTAGIDLAMLEAREGEVDAARELLSDVSQGANRETALRAMDLLGDLHRWQGDPEAATAAYRQVIAAGHPQWSEIARIDLGVLLASYEDHDAAIREIQPAAESPDPSIAAGAHLYLGLIRAGQKDARRAREHFARAAESPVPTVALAARFQAAKLAAEDGDIDGAIALTRVVLAGCEADDPADVPGVRAYLGAMLLRRGDRDEAIPLLSEVGQAGGYEQAFLDEGEHLLDLGEVDAAGDLLATVLESTDPAMATRARLHLGQVRLAQGRFAEAEELLRAALAAGDPPLAATARRYLGSVLARQGRNDDARQVMLPMATPGGEPGAGDEDRAAALRLLGQLEALEGRTEEAAALLRDALAITADGDLRAHVGLELGELLVGRGDAAGGTELLIPLTALPGDLGRRATAILSRASDPRPELPAAPQGAMPPQGVVLPSLPARIRYLLGEVALAEGDAEEAADWFHSVLGTPRDKVDTDRTGADALRARAREALTERG